MFLAASHLDLFRTIDCGLTDECSNGMSSKSIKSSRLRAIVLHKSIGMLKAFTKMIEEFKHNNVFQKDGDFLHIKKLATSGFERLLWEVT